MITDDEVVELSFQLVMDFLYQEGRKGDVLASDVWLSIQGEDWAIQADELSSIGPFIDSFLKKHEEQVAAILKRELGGDDPRANNPPLQEVKAHLMRVMKVERPAEGAR